jgi:anti-sigma B factor antagonist
MRITTRTEGDIFVIGLQGKITGDPETSDLIDTVKSAMFTNQQKLVLDFAGVDWINSSGLGALIAAQGLMRESRGELRLAGLNDSVKMVMVINKLNLVFDIHPTVAEAAASFN